MDEKLNQQNLIDYLIEKNGLRPETADRFVQEFFLLIEKGLQRDGVVKIKGLGTFKLVSVDSRESINVNTGERFVIEGHTKVSFTPDNNVRDTINKPFAHFETVVLNDDALNDETPTFDEDSSGDDDEFVSGIEVISLSKQEELLSSEDEDNSADRPVVFSISNLEEQEEEVNTDSEDDDYNIEADDTSEEVKEPVINENVFTDEVVLSFLRDKKDEDGNIQPLSEILAALRKPAPEPKPTIFDQKIYFKRKRKENTLPPPPIPEPEQNPILPPKVEPRSNTFLIVAIIALLFICGGVVFYLYNPDFIDDLFKKNPNDAPIAQVIPSETPQTGDDSDSSTGIEGDTNVEEDDTIEEITFDDPVAERRINSRPPVATSPQQGNSTISRPREDNTTSNINNNRNTERNPNTTNRPRSQKRIIEKPNLTEYQIMNDNSPVNPDYNSYEIIGSMGTHRLKSGETLTRVSLRFYGTKNLWPYIARYNSIPDPSRLSVGMTLRIPQLQEK